MKIIKKNYHIKAPITTVWQALVDPKVIEEWSGTGAIASVEAASTKGSGVATSTAPEWPKAGEILPKNRL